MDLDPFAEQVDSEIQVDDEEEVDDEEIGDEGIDDHEGNDGMHDPNSVQNDSPQIDEVQDSIYSGNPSLIVKQEYVDGPPQPKLRALCADSIKEGTYKASPEVLKAITELLGGGKMFSSRQYQSRKDDCQAPAHGALQVPELDDLVLTIENHLIKKTSRMRGTKLINRAIEVMCKEMTQFAYDALNPVLQTVHHYNAGNLSVETAVDGCLRSGEFIAQMIHFARITRRRNVLHGLGLKTDANSNLAATLLSLPEENDEDSFLFGSGLLTSLFEDSSDKLAACSKVEKVSSLQKMNFSNSKGPRNQQGRQRSFRGGSNSSGFSGFTPSSTSGYESHGLGTSGFRRNTASYGSRGGRGGFRAASRGGGSTQKYRASGSRGQGWILSTVKGYKLEFDSFPPLGVSHPWERGFNESDDQAISAEVEEMLGKGAIELVVNPPADSFYSQIFIVPKKDGGVRPVINLRHLNSFLVYEHFKMEGIHCLYDLVTPNCYFTKIDLKDAYFSIPIATECHKFLSFQWKGNVYRFKCLPFGLASAPRVFTKMLRPLVSELRNKGIKLIIYLDDLLIISDSPEAAKQDFACVSRCLEALGFILNTEKSVSEPSIPVVFKNDSEDKTDW